MPATAGRIRMPANNRLSVSDSLKLSEIWQKSVGYDPYAPTGGQENRIEPDFEDKARGLFALAKLTGNASLTTPGACRKCGQVGHLSYQCRNAPNISPNGSRRSLVTSVAEPPVGGSGDESSSHSHILYQRAVPSLKEEKGRKSKKDEKPGTSRPHRSSKNCKRKMYKLAKLDRMNRTKKSLTSSRY